jgi:cytosine deaminase
MLVLSRQRDETVMIGDEIEITIVDVRGDKVRLGIRAPKEVAVLRKEVYDAIRRENQAAAIAPLSPADLAGAPVKTPHAHPPKPHEPAPRLRLVKESAADPFLQAALEEAKAGLAEGGLPIGAVLVREGQIIGRGRNRRVQDNNPMAHAEIDCLAHAGRQATYRDTTLYCTLMPCPLCSAAVVQLGIPRIVVGDAIHLPGDPEGLRRHGIEVIDLHDAACLELMAGFIKTHPALWKEGFGQ